MNLEPRLVGRGDEIGRLVQLLDRAEEGKSSCILMSGEAGVGKTRLVEELVGISRSRGFLVLSSSSVYEGLTPFLPFVEALREGGCEHLVTEETPRVESVLLVTHSGLLVDQVTRMETVLDPDIFASMLTTVGNFVKETLSLLSGEERDGMLNVLGYKDYRIVVNAGEMASIVVILTGKENEHLLGDVRELLAKVERRFGSVLASWDGDARKVEGIGGVLEPLVTSGKYDGGRYEWEDPKARRDMLFDNVAMGLARISRTRPILLCIEDLQWADPSTLALLHYIAENSQDSRIFVLGTFRPEDLATGTGEPHPLVRTLGLMESEDLCDIFGVGRLPEEAVDEFMNAMLGQVELERSLVERVYGETEGNPLFIIQLVRLLVEEGMIVPGEDVWTVDPSLKAVEIPSKVYHVIARRLDRIMSEYRRILDHASVVGVTFSSETLAFALDADRGRLLEHLREIEDRHLLIHPIEEGYRFDHTKIKEVLYDQIPQDLRMEYHSKVAKAIERLTAGDLDPVVGDLAFHYASCRDEDKALHYLLEAAARAKGHYSNYEAVRFYEQAMDFTKDPEQRITVLEELGQLYVFLGMYNESIQAYEQAYGQTMDRRRRAGIHARMGSTYSHMGEYDKGLQVCEEALRLIGDEDCVEKGLIHGTMGVLYEKKRDYKNAIHHLGLVSKYPKDVRIRDGP